MTIIVGYVADLRGTTFQIRPNAPVVEEGGELFVVGSRDTRSPSHRIPARVDGPGIHMLPPEAHEEFSAVHPGQDPGGAQQVVVVGDELRDAMRRISPDDPLTKLVGDWATVDSGEHVAGVQRIGPFTELRRESMLRLRRLLLAGLGGDQSELDTVFRVFRAVAPREEIAYLVGVAAYYRGTDQTAYSQQIADRAKLLGLGSSDLDEMIATALAEATTDEAGIVEVTPAAAARAAHIIATVRAASATYTLPPKLLALLSATDGSSKADPDEPTPAEVGAALVSQGFSVALQARTTGRAALPSFHGSAVSMHVAEPPESPSPRSLRPSVVRPRHWQHFALSLQKFSYHDDLEVDYPAESLSTTTGLTGAAQ